jgi:hypothetical protein
MNNLVTQISTLVVLMLVSVVSFAHQGMHAAGQAHVGEHHMGLMEIALAVIVMIAVGAWALKEVKSKK